MKEKLLIIDNDTAAGRMLEHLLEIDTERYDITVFNAEPRGHDNRLMPSTPHTAEKSYHDSSLPDESWYARHGIRLLTSMPVQTIDTEQQWVISANGEQFAYDKLVMATGSKPIMIYLPGHTLQGVQAYRHLDDVDYLLDVARHNGRAVVIGGGLPSLQAASELKEQGMDVCVVHLFEHFTMKQLDSGNNSAPSHEFEQRGIELRTASHITDIIGDSQVRGVLFADGSVTHCELVIVALGIRPSTQLAARAGLAINHGILVDDTLRTSAVNVYALGDCVEHQRNHMGPFDPLYDMAKVLASSLTDQAAIIKSTNTTNQQKIDDDEVFALEDRNPHSIGVMN